MQAPAALVTSRQLQNVHTGLDLSVPQHQEVRGKMLSGHVEYQILVVTRLAAFKSAKHKPEDAVQFLVSKKYSDIEEFYQKLSRRYAAASLPPLPRKVLFVGESDIRERRAMFSEILHCVAKDVQLAGSPELLEFLGTRSPGAAGVTSRDTGGQAGHSEEAFDFFEQQDREASVGLPVLGQKSESEEQPLEEEEEALDPLGILRSKKPKKCPKVAVKAKPVPRLTIFDEEEEDGPDVELFGPGGKLSWRGPRQGAPPIDSLKLFDDPDLGGPVPLGDPLLLPAACGRAGLTTSLDGRGGSAELFRVEEDLDQILNLGAEPTPKPKPPVAEKPALPRKPAVPPRAAPPEASLTQQRRQQQVQAMDEVGILQYIQDHEAQAQAPPSLF
ncbi:HCLS1-binding protein 3 isoform X3 [Heterocephalus glaber]|uniref:HCLS1-binding protein 3 n=1 Tax=Heterocephalus glaber TaxID=10181 RepID=A0AAX6NXE1_HETGA|nr:HCLS1-binding protein 3 isoform X3 [Heterocephalus glaber]